MDRNFDSDVDASGDWEPETPGSAPHQAVEDEREFVEVHPAEGTHRETARALLDAADDPSEVVFTDGKFRVPADVADRAEIPDGPAEAEEPSRAAKTVEPPKTPDPGDALAPADKPAPKKATPRKAPAKKAAPRKAAAKKAAPRKAAAKKAK